MLSINSISVGILLLIFTPSTKLEKEELQNELLNKSFEELKARIRNKQFVEAEKILEHGEFSEQQSTFANALLVLLRDEKAGALISYLKHSPEGDEKSEGFFVLSEYYLKKNEMRQFNRYKRELGDRSKLPFERGLFSLLSAKERRKKRDSETAIGFIEEGIKVLGTLPEQTHKEFLALTYHEGAINFIVLRRYQEGGDYLELALKSIQEFDLPLTRGKILNSFGNMYYQIDELNRALKFYEYAVSEKVRISDPVPSTMTKLQMVTILEDVEDYTKAEILLNDVLRTSNEDPVIQSLSFSAFGRICAETNRQKEAIKYFQKAITFMEEQANSHEIATLENDIGMLFLELEEEDKAMSYFIKSLEKWRKFDSLTNIANVLTNLARAYLYQANYDMAIKTMEECLETQKEIGIDFSTASTLGNLGHLHLDIQELERAKQYFLNALKLKVKLGDEKLLTDSYNQLALVSLYESDLGQVEKYLVQARECCFSGQEDVGILDTTINLGIFKFFNRELQSAEQLMWEAYDFSKILEDKMAGFEALEYLRRINVKNPQKKIEIILDQLEIIRDFSLNEIKLELSLDLALNLVLLNGTKEAVKYFRNKLRKLRLFELQKEDMEVIYAILSIELNPEETIIRLLTHINELMKAPVFLINRGIFYSQLLIKVIEKTLPNIDGEFNHIIVEGVNNLLSTAVYRKINEFETLCQVLLSVFNKKNLSEIKVNSTRLTHENYVEKLFDPTCWLPEAEVEVDPVFMCANQLMILQYSISKGVIEKNKLKNKIGVSGKLIDYYIKNLIEADYVVEDQGEQLHFSEVGLIKFRQFISSLKAILITKLSI